MVAVKILLVDDNNLQTTDIKVKLESFGYDVSYVASRCKEALEIMPDLILMDIFFKRRNRKY